MANPILPRAPLILVLAEVNFSPILSISKKIAAIQEQLRQIGFPEFEIEKKGRGPEPRWQFNSKNHRTAVTISHDTITSETSEYSEFNSFINHFRQVLDFFKEIARPNLLKSISLRYVDLIRDLDGKKADDLIESKFIQLRFVPGIQNHYQYESVEFETERGIVRVNLIKSFDDTMVPPDIKPAVSIPAEKASEDIILDINHIAFFEKTDFSTKRIIEMFQQIHDHDITATFKSIVKEEAFLLWGKGKTV